VLRHRKLQQHLAGKIPTRIIKVKVKNIIRKEATKYKNEWFETNMKLIISVSRVGTSFSYILHSPSFTLPQCDTLAMSFSIYH
jgi:hypothetical protein